jgi:hypothetical protein
LTGDLNHDNAVNLFDAVLMANCFGTTFKDANYNEEADLNGDGIIDIFDVVLLCRNFGRTR